MKNFWEMNGAEQMRNYDTEVVLTLVCGKVFSSVCKGVVYPHQIIEQGKDPSSEFVYLEMQDNGMEMMGLRKKDISRVNTKVIKKLEVMGHIGTDEL